MCGASNDTLWTMSFSHWEALRYRDHINKLRITMFVNDLLLFLVKLFCVVQLQLSSHGDTGDNTISHRPTLIFIILLPAYFELYVSGNLGSCTSCLSANCSFPIGRNIFTLLGPDLICSHSHSPFLLPSIPNPTSSRLKSSDPDTPVSLHAAL